MAKESSQFRIQQLTGLRGAAVLLVVLSHAADVGMAPHVLGGGFGKIGVMIFFVLSAFLMTKLYLDRPFKKNWQGYVVARVGRVFPLYLLLVVISIPATSLFTPWRYAISGYGEIAQHLLFLKASNEMWAVPVEVQFYLVFFAFWGGSSRWPGLRKGIGLVSVLAAIWVPLFGLVAMVQPGFNTLGHTILFFLIGIVLAIHDDRLARRFPVALGGPWSLVLAVLLLLACTPELRKATGTYVSLWIDPIILVSVTLIFLMVRHGKALATLLNTRVLQFLGDISYGIYLIHGVVLYSVAAHLKGQPLLGLLIVTAVTLVLSVLSFHYYEKPLAQAFRRLDMQRTTTRSVEIPTRQ